MTKFIPLASPDIREEDIAAATAVMQSGMLVQGPRVAELEGSVQSYLNTQSSVLACSNGTATMHMALVAAGIGPGDEVIVPAFSYVATANVVELVGATPVFVDIDVETYNIDVAQIRGAVTSKTKAIIPVHEFGLMCDIQAVIEIAEEFGLIVIEDAACALGATFKGQSSGTFGDFGSFSLHPRKAITSGEGGLLVVKDLQLAEQLQKLRSHGIQMHEGGHDFVLAGFNYRLTDIQAALVNSQLGRFSATLEKRRALAEVYTQSLSWKDCVKPSVPDECEHSWQSYHIVLEPGVDRLALQEYLREHGVQASYGAQCIPAQKFYLDKYGLDHERLFPNAFRAWNCGLCLPLYEKLEPADIEYISEKVNQF